MFRLDKAANKVCNKALVVTGLARSGTTIVGKILHSCQGVEYAFEPPMLTSLFPLMDHLSKNDWMLLYETYLYEEFLVNALAGRNLNFNPHDDSSILNVKPGKVIDARMSRSHRKTDIEKNIGDSILAYKIPDILPWIPKLKEYYPGTRVVIMTRDAIGSLNSILAKEWFSDHSIRYLNVIWPNRYLNGCRVPFWVRENDETLWCELNEIDRCAYYYVRINETLTDITDCIIVRYNEFVEFPEQIIRKLCSQLDLSWGEKTDALVASVKLQPKQRDMTLLERISPSLQEQVLYYSSLSGATS